jgi:ATP-dependent DNA ligase
MPPKVIKPMLAVAVAEPFDSDSYLFEIKWDGIRCVAFLEAERVRLQSRDLIDITAQFPELVCLAHLPDGSVLDGELVAMEANKPCLGKIQGRALLQDRHRIAAHDKAACGASPSPGTAPLRVPGRPDHRFRGRAWARL